MPAERIERASLYSEVTNRIIAELEEGRLPWVQPWDSAACGCTMPQNAGTAQKKGMPAGAWIQFPNMEAYKAREQELLQAIADSDGNDDVVIYLRDIKNIKILPANLRVKADETLMEKLASQFGKENVKFITKPIENRSKID